MGRQQSNARGGPSDCRRAGAGVGPRRGCRWGRRGEARGAAAASHHRAPPCRAGTHSWRAPSLPWPAWWLVERADGGAGVWASGGGAAPMRARPSRHAVALTTKAQPAGAPLAAPLPVSKPAARGEGPPGACAAPGRRLPAAPRRLACVLLQHSQPASTRAAGAIGLERAGRWRRLAQPATDGSRAGTCGGGKKAQHCLRARWQQHSSCATERGASPVHQDSPGPLRDGAAAGEPGQLRLATAARPQLMHPSKHGSSVMRRGMFSVAA